MNGIGDKGQPWCSPTPTEKGSDVLPVMWTKVFQQLFKWLVATGQTLHTPGAPPTEYSDAVECLL